MSWHTKWGDFPELYKEVEILMTDGNIKRDMMVKGNMEIMNGEIGQISVL